MSVSKRIYGLAGWVNPKRRVDLHEYTEFDCTPSNPGLPERVHVETHAMAMDKNKSARAEGRPTLFVDEEMSAEYPELLDFLREERWSDGTPRKRGNVMFVIEGSYMKAWIHDKDGQRSGWVSGGSFKDVLAAAELALSTGQLDWRPDKRDGGGRKWG